MKSIKYYNIDTLTDLSTVKFSGDSADSTYFTYSNTTPQSGTPDIPWHSVCSVSSVNQIYSHGKFYFPGKSGYSGTVYGVQWDTSDPSPECTRIGNMSLHATLPVQSQMVGGLMLDDGTFNEFGNQSDWTSYTRDGSLGQVMVRIPTFWIKFETLGNIYRVLMSSEPVIGFKTVKEMYCSAYEAALDRTNLKLSSVVNKTAQYRGGNNNASWDSEDTAGNGGESHRSLLGRPATSISLTDFRTYARNRGSSAWNCYFYLMHKILYWLYVVEYATLNSQKAFNASLDSNGFHQGGLGDGVSDWVADTWQSFNSKYPLIPCGVTDEYGNTTYAKNYSVYDSSGNIAKTFSVPRYRGIENPFGHIYKYIDGVLINATASGTSDAYVTNDPNEFSSTSCSNYELVGNESRGVGFIKELHLGNNGDIIAKSTNGSSSSYYCDYHNVYNIDRLGSIVIGGSVSMGAGCGLALTHSDPNPSSMYPHVGSRLTYFDAWGVVYEVHQWLQGRNGAYINTNYKIKTIEDSFDIKFKWDGTAKNPDNQEQDIFGYADLSSNGIYSCSWLRNPLTDCVAAKYEVHDSDFPSIDVSQYNDIVSLKLSCDTSDSCMEINGTNYINSTNGLTATTLGDCYLFNINAVPGRDVSTWYFHGDISYFNINPNKVHMYPVKLLKSIPAKYDGNGIARQAGECGMYDTVSGKFFGNVANRGTFSVSD